MLSDCSSCKFYNPELCAVNPMYRVRADRWRGRLSERDLADLSFLGQSFRLVLIGSAQKSLSL